jgi:hypothetical protein
MYSYLQVELYCGIAEFMVCYEAMRQALWLKKYVPGLRLVDNIRRQLKYTATMSQQYFTLTIIRKQRLPSTSISYFML